MYKIKYSINDKLCRTKYIFAECIYVQIQYMNVCETKKAVIM